MKIRNTLILKCFWPHLLLHKNFSSWSTILNYFYWHYTLFSIARKPALLAKFNGVCEDPNPYWARLETMAQAFSYWKEACPQQWDVYSLERYTIFVHWIPVNGVWFSLRLAYNVPTVHSAGASLWLHLQHGWLWRFSQPPSFLAGYINNRTDLILTLCCRERRDPVEICLLICSNAGGDVP